MDKELWSESEIQLRCGKLSSRKGKELAAEGLVALHEWSLEGDRLSADIIGKDAARVELAFGKHGLSEASCSSCPSLGSYNKSCKHIAAVLYAVKQRQKEKSTVNSRLRAAHKPASTRTAEQLEPAVTKNQTQPGSDALAKLMAAFIRKPRAGSSLTRPALFDQREPLDMRLKFQPKIMRDTLLFAVSLSAHIEGGWQPIFRVRSFLERVTEGRPATITRKSAFDPEKHRFKQETAALIRQLGKIVSTEKLLRWENAGLYSQHREELLEIPPAEWPMIIQLAEVSPEARLRHGEHEQPFTVHRTGSMDLSFELSSGLNGGGVLSAEGLGELLVLAAYGAALHGGKLHDCGSEACERLTALQQLFRLAPDAKISLNQDQLEELSRHVLPGLGRLAKVRLSSAMAQRIEHPPLKAKLYLDRVKDRLLADIEFHYGEEVFRPLQQEEPRTTGKLLVRDREKEYDILELMNEGRMSMTERGCFLDSEEDEFHFLYTVLPRLERLVQVYATTAVKTRLHPEAQTPIVRVYPDERTDWLEFRFDLDGVPESEIRSVLRSLEEKRPYHRLRNGALLPLQSDAYQEMIRYINETGFTYAERTSYGYRLPAAAGVPLLDAAVSNRVVQSTEQAKQLLQALKQPGHANYPLPVELDHVLRDYQKLGYQWMKTLAAYRFGGILADEMGLGKTLQALAFMLSILPEIRSERRPALVVCPSSLVYNWAAELEKFAPTLRVLIPDGTKKERLHKLKSLQEADIVVASYPQLRLDGEVYAAHPYTALVLDEAQTIKNESTLTAKAVAQVTAGYKFALTGTPVENHAADLWSIFHAIFPRLLGSKKQFEELRREELALRIRPFLLRRLKSSVLEELPDKIETLQSAELLPEQKKLYAAYLVQLQQEALKHIDKDELEQNRIRILAGITRLRQICGHPALFVEDYAGGSAKLEQLVGLIQDALESGRRPLVFSQFTTMLGLIRRRLEDAGLACFQLDGSTPARDRVPMCRRFNEGERDVFLLSLKAGGTGLNLTGADTVILYDLWWNPAVEQQAMDRAHRIGQKRVVHVIRLLARGTIEAKMVQLQQRKQGLMEELVQPGGAEPAALSEEELLDLLGLPGH
ncbi:DEAD/DEAH box helicase [Paenibacillus pasadenensis]|uniref:DEAD/DEAH box helicase n=1 Tax=Paenibacillus pasadenensis TaxID=217090 RepID=UPI00203F885B|nr:DEAD/DEAH box helicase [Paenibacillus pasadenensis]MCM3747241.1 DEAD/DEAH box helicase [Paenibacillus pasadenensis]